MLVQKKSQKKSLILGAVLVFIVVVTIIVLTIGSGGPDGEIINGLENTNTTVQPVTIIDIDNTFFGKEELVGLRDRSGQSYTEQYSGIPMNAQSVPAPIGAYVLNPQVGSKVILYWDLSPRYVSVKIYRSSSQSSGERGELIAEVSKRNYYQDTEVEEGTNYYTLISVGPNGQESDEMVRLTVVPTDIFPPKAPVGVAIKDSSDGKSIRISWIDPTDEDFLYVRIYRSQIEGSIGKLILDQKVENSTYLDENVLEDVEYFYTITAVDSSGNESEKSLLPVGGNTNPFKPSF